MRITNGMMNRNLLNNLNLNMERMNRLNKQAASGKKFDRPSDDPVAMSKSLKLYTDVSRVDQYERNVRDAQSWLDSTEGAISELGDILQRTRELAVDGANGSKTEDDTQKMAEEIKQLKEQVIKLANTSHAGRSIFTGYQTDKELLNEDGTYNIDLDEDQVSVYNVGIAEKLEINTLGGKLFGVKGIGINTETTDSTVPDKSYLVDVFDQLVSAMGQDGGDPANNGVAANFDQDEVSNLIGEIDNVMENSLTIRAEIGAKTNRLEMTSSRLSSEKLNFTSVLSENEDVDQAEVIMQFKMAEVVYNSSLAMGGRSIQSTLVDFLR